jgi:hypothetical protein
VSASLAIFFEVIPFPNVAIQKRKQIMNTRFSLACAMTLALIGLAPAAYAQATNANVLFSDFDDSFTGNPTYRIPEYFDVSKSALAANDPNTINIGLDPYYGFAVGSISSGCCSVTQLPSLAFDTVSFRVTAPEGSFLTAVALNVAASLTSNRFGSSRFAGTGAVDGKTLTINNGVPAVFDLSGQQKTSAIVTLSIVLTSTGNNAGRITVASATAAFMQ